MQTKVTTTHDLKKLIRVSESWLGNSGLELCFEVNGAEHYYEFDPVATAKLFKANGLIIDWYQSWRGPVVKFEYAVTEEDSATTEMIFEMFVMNFRFSQFDAICLASHLLREQRLGELSQTIINNAHAVC
jgi:hypothetical protein